MAITRRKIPTVEEIYHEFRHRGLISWKNSYPGEKKARDLAGGAMAEAADWLDFLPGLMTLPAGRRYSELSPGGFHDMILQIGESASRAPLSKASKTRPKGGIKQHGWADDAIWVIDGGISIRMPKLILKGRTAISLPKIVVRGDVEIAHCPQLGSADIVCFGELTIDSCPRLLRVKGEVFGGAGITNCGVETVGADFRCTGDLFFGNCRRLQKINCEVGGDLAVNTTGLRSTEPAFFVSGNAHIFGCKDLRKMRGTIDGKAQITVDPRQAVDFEELLVRGNSKETETGRRRT
jgi:hypothetical protein